MWDGKIGIWPFAHLSPALRSSTNRPAGTLEWKLYSVNKAAYKDMIIEKVIPAIEEKWPQGYCNTPIWIQQDNASSHFKNDDPDFAMRVGMSDLQISMYFQPPNSPDLNVLNLGFFASLQSIVVKAKPETNNSWSKQSKQNLDPIPTPESTMCSWHFRQQCRRSFYAMGTMNMSCNTWRKHSWSKMECCQFQLQYLMMS